MVTKFSLLVSLLLVFSVELASAETKLRVGVITPLSGTLVASGESVRNSILLADELFDKSDLATFTFEDDGFQPKNSVTAARKFIAEKVDAIIIFGTPTALAVIPITESARVPLAAITIVDKVVQARQFGVRHFVAWQEENRRLLEEVMKRQYKKVAIVTTINDASLSLRDGFLKDGRIEVVLDKEFVKDDLDFQSVATKIRRAKPDAVYNLLFAPQGSAFMKALRRIGCQTPVFGAHNVEDPSEIAAADGAYDGIWFVTGDDRPGAAYAKAYADRFGIYPAMGWANAFDYAKMMIEAASADIPVLDYLKQLKGFEGAFGRYGATDGNTFELRATIKTINGSSIVAE